jgi:hypothetical protein
MLKPADVPPASSERPVGDLVHQLLEDGKAFARAEIDIAKAVATDKARAYRLPAILIAGSLFFLQSAITVLAVAVCLWLVPIIGPLLAGLVAFLLFGGIAGVMVWVGIRKIRGAA